MEGIYFEITVIITVAAALTILFRLIKQPPILAYILTGIILGALGILHVESNSDLTILGQVGVTLLLFLLGLELRIRELRSIGRTAIIAGSLQVGVTFILGSLLAYLLGLSLSSALYIGLAVSFSSTIIIVKLLSDKKDLNSMHGKLAIGILLIQDFFAVMTIIFLTGIATDQGGSLMDLLPQVGFVLLKIAALVGVIVVLSKYVFPKILPLISKSTESLFLFSLGWVFLFTAIVTSGYIGFSLEIGGFLAGLALANSNEAFQIVARMKALRDFFITIFFVMLGLEMSFDNISAVILPAIVITLFVLFVKPLIVMGATGILGYRKRTSFLTGLSLAQVSEFSLIILFLGQSTGRIPGEVVTIGVVVALITFVSSTYYITSQNKLYENFKKFLDVFERKNVHAGAVNSIDEFEKLSGHVVVVGGHQMGQSIIHALENSGYEVAVVDFDPDVVTQLKEKEIPAMFGDIADPEIQERVGIDKAKLVVSTVSDPEDNLLLLRGVQHINKKAKIIVVAFETDDAKMFYKEGADYVVLPHLAGGRHLAKILVDEKHLELIENYKSRDLSALG